MLKCDIQFVSALNYTFRSPRSLISLHWSPKITEIPLYRSDLRSGSLIFSEISVFFESQWTEIQDRDCEILKVRAVERMDGPQ